MTLFKKAIISLGCIWATMSASFSNSPLTDIAIAQELKQGTEQSADDRQLQQQLQRDQSLLQSKLELQQKYNSWLSDKKIWCPPFGLNSGLKGKDRLIPGVPISLEEVVEFYQTRMLLAKQDEIPQLIENLSNLRRESNERRGQFILESAEPLQREIKELQARISNTSSLLGLEDSIADEDDLGSLQGLIGDNDKDEKTDQQGQLTDSSSLPGLKIATIASGTLTDDCKGRLRRGFREWQAFLGGRPAATKVQANQINLRISEERRAVLNSSVITLTGTNEDRSVETWTISLDFDPAIGQNLVTNSDVTEPTLKIGDVVEVRGTGTGNVVAKKDGKVFRAENNNVPSKFNWVAKLDHGDVWYLKVRYIAEDEKRNQFAQFFTFEYRLDSKDIPRTADNSTPTEFLIPNGEYDLRYTLDGTFKVQVGPLTWKNHNDLIANARIELASESFIGKSLAELSPETKRLFRQRGLPENFPTAIELYLIRKGDEYVCVNVRSLRKLGFFVMLTAYFVSRAENASITEDAIKGVINDLESIEHSSYRLRVKKSDTDSIAIQLKWFPKPDTLFQADLKKE